MSVSKSVSHKQSKKNNKLQGKKIPIDKRWLTDKLCIVGTKDSEAIRQRLII